jgi:O-antigen/teichoic acid export membrane protein
MKKNINTYIRAGIGYTIGNIILKGINFITIPIFTRILSTADYGKYNSFIAYESILFIIIGLGIHTSIKNAKFDYEDRFNDYLTNCVYLVLISTAVSLLLINIFKPLFSKLFSLNRFELICLIICSASGAIMNIYTTKVSMELQYKKYLLISFFNSISNITISIFLIYLLSDNYLGRVLGTTISSFLTAAYIIYSLIIKHKANFEYDYIKYGVKISIPIIPHGISQIVLSQFDRVMIQRLINSSYAGIYSFTYNIAIIFQVIATSINSVWEPWFFEQMNKKNYNEIKRKASIYIEGISFIAAFIILAAPELMMILAPRNYWPGINIVAIIVLGTYFSSIYTLPAGVEYFHKKTNYIAIGTFSVAILNIILNSIYIPKYGYVAAAYTTLISYVLYFIFHMILSYKIMKFWLYDLKIIFIQIMYISIVTLLTTIYCNNFVFRLFFFIINLILCFLFVKFKLKLFKNSNK